MEPYLQERIKREFNARIAGVVLALAINGAGLLLVSFTGIKYLYPPPPETPMLIDFEQELEPVKEVRGSRPRMENPDKTKDVNLVQKSQSPRESMAQNLTPQTKQDNFGDVPVDSIPEKEEPKLDPRASFPGMAKKDTSLTAQHSAQKSTQTYKAGQADGNTSNGKTDERPNAHLQGRSVDKSGLRRPVYNVQERGTVVVTIYVDQYGNVKKAIPGADGTTVTSSALWNAARNAAMETHFNPSTDAPALQEGTITYIFNLK